MNGDIFLYISCFSDSMNKNNFSGIALDYFHSTIFPTPIEDGVPFMIGIGLIYGAFKLKGALNSFISRNEKNETHSKEDEKPKLR